MRIPTKRQSGEGFTLIEMMIVVVIIAVLVAVAIVAYTRHIKKGRLVQERVFVSKIQALQETYFQQNGVYLNVTNGSYFPAATPPKGAYSWNPGVGSKWEILGARPEGNVTYFHWDVTASVPAGHAPTGQASSLGIANDGVPWYYIKAEGDLGGDGAPYTQLMATSRKTNIWSLNEGE